MIACLSRPEVVPYARDLPGVERHGGDLANSWLTLRGVAERFRDGEGASASLKRLFQVLHVVKTMVHLLSLRSALMGVSQMQGVWIWCQEE